MRLNRKRLLAILTVILAVFIAAGVWRVYPLTQWLPLAGLSLLTFMFANLALDLRPGLVNSLDSSVVTAAYLLYGPLGAGTVASFVLPLRAYIRDRTPLVVVVRNMAAAFSVAAVAGFVVSQAIRLLSGPSSMGWSSTAQGFFVAVPFVVLMNWFNDADVALYYALSKRMRFVDALKSVDSLADMPGNLVLAILGYALAVLVSAGSWVGAVLLLAPVVVVRRAFRVYAELASMYASTLGALVSAIEAKDPYTKGHSERVAGIARKIGAALKLGKSEIVALERAALLHDVGKIAIPGRILQYQGRLSDEDYDLIQQHPAMAVEVLAHIDYAQELLPIIRHHHERVGGLGYPDGLNGDEVPLLSRILAVADAYDAMTSDRPYRPGMSREEAVRELYRCSGTQFDPRAVEALVQVLQGEHGDALDDGAPRTPAPSQ
ncbi:HD-GYP domain-containing protein [Coriobacteriia bacterium Es71-Z0120]|uniref:HD-GYP domain-containing protein n=1 Tax=Parvivirga hydrogeniphila TaxID=2939460 RepID=UPI002260F172|nr:HD-GYP domain-containing protein [Parvivirga hydrogeniphila]MCL4078806.1 HD-GYP domain-containing protein [Parvivirga hydrogeniphila]